MNNADVVIVGAGPAGAGAAIALAERGYDVALLDRAVFPRPKPCGEFINPGACDLIEEMFGIDREELLGAGGALVGQIRLQLAGSSHVEIPMVDALGSHVFGISLPRMTLDAMLLKRCSAASVRIYEDHNVRSVRRAGRTMVVTGSNGGGDSFELRSKMVLASDGTHSRIAREAGLTRRAPRLCSAGIVAHFKDVIPDPSVQTAGPIANKPSVWMFPSSGDGTMFGFAHQAHGTAVLSGSIPTRFSRALASDPKAFLASWIGSRQGLEAALGPRANLTDIRTTSCFGHKLKRSFDPGLLFLGDAARFVDPFSGEGIHHAVETGLLAARVADRALRVGDTEARTLAIYEVERAELSRRYSLCGLVRSVCSQPRCVNFLGNRLLANPELARTLIGAVVDILPPRAVFCPAFMLRALCALSS